MATETVTWGSIGSAGSWVASSGTLLACVQTEGDGTHGIEPTSVSSMFGVPADFTAGSGETVNSVTIRAVMRVATAGDSCQVSNMLRVGASGNVSHATAHIVDQTVFTEYEWVWLTQPAGGAWTVAAANDIARCYVDPALSTLGDALHLDVIQVVLDYGASSTDATVLPPALALTLDLPTPTVVATSNVGVDSPPLTLALSFPAPTVTAENVVTGDPLTLTLGFPAPTVSAAASVDANVTAPTLTLTLDFPPPTIGATTSATVEAPALGLGLTFPVPTVSAGGSVTIPAPPLGLLATFPAPTITAQRNVTTMAPVLDIALAVPAPVAYGTTGTPVAPASRTLSVLGETRTLSVLGESRVLTIPTDHRTLEA